MVTLTLIDICREVKHENIIKTHTIYQDHSSMYFLQDLMDTTLDSVIHSPTEGTQEAKVSSPILVLSLCLCRGLPLTGATHTQLQPTPLPMSFLLDVCLHIARGMNYLHARAHPIVHRDLKPENILYAFAFARPVRSSTVR
jgi:serine/threonine protein kinase